MTAAAAPPLWRLLLVVCVIVAACHLLAAVQAAVITVTSNADGLNNSGTLRQALAAAAASPDSASEIQFDLPSGSETITLLTDLQLGPSASGRALKLSGSLGGGARVVVTTVGSARYTTALPDGSTLALEDLVLKGISFTSGSGVTLSAARCDFLGDGKPGRALTFNEGATASIDGCVLASHTCTSTDNVGCAVMAYRAAGLQIRNTAFTNNIGVAATSGGAIDIALVGPVVIEGVNFTNNGVKGFGGALNAFGILPFAKSLTLRDVVFEGTGGVAALNGGQAYVNAIPGVLLERVIFRNGSASQRGGCAYFTALENAQVTDARFEGCSAPSGGGAYVNVWGGISFTGSALRGCRAGSEGGALFFDQAVVTVTDTVFSGNWAEASGGGAMAASSGQVTLLRVTATGNSAPHGGALAATSGYGLTVDSSMFQDNVATTDGGGALWVSDILQGFAVSSSTFKDNTASDLGGAVFINTNTGGPATFSGDVKFQGNQATNGGAMFLQQASASLSGCSFTNNRVNFQRSTLGSGGNGAAVYLWDHSSATVTQCMLEGNTAAYRGGAFYSWQSQLTITRTLVVADRNQYAGAVDAEEGSTATISECTFDSSVPNAQPSDSTKPLVFAGSGVSLAVSSSTTVGGAGSAGAASSAAVLVVSASSVTISNSIIVGGLVAVQGVTSPTIRSNLFVDATLAQNPQWAASNIGGDPRLGLPQDNGGPTRTRLPLAGSPAVDAGDASLLSSDDTTNGDQRGSARVVCGAPDIGAVEGPPQAAQLLPGAVPLVFTTPRVTPVIVAAPGLLARSGPQQQFVITSRAVPELVSPPGSGGSVLFDTSGTGGFTYTPPTGFAGVDSFAVRLTTPGCQGLPPSAPVTVTIKVVNNPPVATSTPLSTLEDTTLNAPAPGVLGACSDPDGDPLTVAGFGQPAHGKVQVLANGAVTYTPDANYNGPDSFVFNITDGQGGYAWATAQITVVSVNDNPTVTNPVYATNESQALVVDAASGLLASATDVDGDTLTVLSHTEPANGNLTLDSTDGSFIYVTHSPYFNGRDGFTFVVSDGHGGTAQGTVEINIAPVNFGPIITAGPTPSEAYTISRNALLTIPVLGNPSSGSQVAALKAPLFWDPEGDPMVVRIVQQPGLGSAAVDPATGAITYTPPYMKKGAPEQTTTLVIQASDTPGGLASPPLTVSLVLSTVKPALDTPVVNGLALRLTSCTAAGTNIDTFSVSSGSVTLVKAAGGTTEKGVPSGLNIQVAPMEATTWPGKKDKPKSHCFIKRPATNVHAGSDKTWDYGTCAPCLKCLKEMGFSCSKAGQQYKLRAQAAAPQGAAYADSEWSDAFVFTPTCEGKALTC